MKYTEYRFEVETDIDLRVDKYLSDQLPEVSRSQIKKMIDEGHLIIDGIEVTKAGTRVREGNLVEITVVDDSVDAMLPEHLPLDIIYEDENVILINKPAGIVVHPGAGNPSGTLSNALLAHYPPVRYVGEPDRPGVVHRLDKDTSGVLVFAKTDKAYRWLVKQFKSRDLQKSYIALVDGHPPTPTGRIEAPIERDVHHRTRMAAGLRGQGKPAVSEYFELERFENHSLVEIHPITGRTHQIRVHMSYIGNPIVGDTLYGKHRSSIAIGRFFLHAKSLSMKLPGDRIQKTFESPLPEDLVKVLESLRKK